MNIADFAEKDSYILLNTNELTKVTFMKIRHFYKGLKTFSLPLE